MERKLGLKLEASVAWHPRKTLHKVEHNMNFVPKVQAKLDKIYHEKMIEAFWGMHDRMPPKKLEKLRIRHITQER